MARTLFFIELAIFAALSIAFPALASDTAAAFIAPAAISLIVPLAAVLAVWPRRAVLGALRCAFSPERPAPAEARLYARILEAMASFSRSASVLGLLSSLAALCNSSRAAGRPDEWALVGLYMSAYALLNGMLWKLLAELAARLEPRLEPARTEATEASPRSLDDAATLAARFGLTPRESETAILIAGGMSYKESAYELGITLRTVKAHMSRVYEKTGAASNVALALLIRGDETPRTKVQ
jgi:Response regulator containing a CheY-like receiver domain and an HTH DNA-binding domain